MCLAPAPLERIARQAMLIQFPSTEIRLFEVQQFIQRIKGMVITWDLMKDQ
jgi:hypothetical protein